MWVERNEARHLHRAVSSDRAHASADGEMDRYQHLQQGRPNLRSITETAYVVSLLSAADVMSVTRPLAVCLQEQRQDLPGALKLIHAAQKCLEDKRLHAEK